MDERIRFVIRLKDGESMAALCREFGISRKTGYKIVDRSEECGLEVSGSKKLTTASDPSASCITILVISIYREWWARQDSNLRPPACEAGALTN